MTTDLKGLKRSPEGRIRLMTWRRTLCEQILAQFGLIEQQGSSIESAMAFPGDTPRESRRMPTARRRSILAPNYSLKRFSSRLIRWRARNQFPADNKQMTNL